MSSMKVCRSGTSVCSRARARTSSSVGPTSKSAATCIQDLERVGQGYPSPGKEDVEVVEHVGRLFAHALVRLFTDRTHHLLRLLLHLLAVQRGVGQELCGVAAGG